MGLLLFSFRALSFSVYAWGALTFPPVVTWEKRVLALTFWCLLINTLYFGACTFLDYDVILSLFSKPKPQQVKNVRAVVKVAKSEILHPVFRSLCFPCSIVVSAMFWGLFAIDRELIFPKALDGLMSPIANHIQHTLPVFVCLVEAILEDHYKYGESSFFDLTLVSTLGFLYISVIFAARFFSGYWLYPVLAVLQVPFKLLIISFGVGLLFFAYYIGRVINLSLHKKDKPKLKAK